MATLPPHVRLHEIRSPQDDALLEQVYNGLFQRQFPNPDEREPLEDMIERIRAKEGSIAVMLRYDPQDTEFKGEARPVGFVSSDIYRDEKHTTGLIGYITKDNEAEKEFGEKYKSHHLRDFTVQRMHEMVKEEGGRGLDLVLWEADKVDNHSGSMDPQVRQDIITGRRAQNQGEGWNFERVGRDGKEFDYVGPPLEDGKDVDRGMDLFAAGVEEGPDGKARLKPGGVCTAHEARAAKSFLTNYWEACEMPPDHPELRTMQGSMDRIIARREVSDMMYGRGAVATPAAPADPAVQQQKAADYVQKAAEEARAVAEALKPKLTDNRSWERQPGDIAGFGQSNNVGRSR